SSISWRTSTRCWKSRWARLPAQNRHPGKAPTASGNGARRRGSRAPQVGRKERGLQAPPLVRFGARGTLDLRMNPHFTVHPFEKYSVVEFRTPSLMDPVILEDIGKE